jgi:RimJ/RimL family protein N-acetyltransferase
MPMPVLLRPGKVYQELTLKDGRNVVLRAPRWDDLDDFVTFINELVEERTEIARTEKETRDEEADWLGARLADIETGKMIAMVGEVGGHVIASSEVAARPWEQSHVGGLGIAILKEGRGVGLGTAMMNALLQLAKQAGLRTVILDHFATNSVARRLYEKVGFKEVGRIPKGVLRDGNYIDLVRMAVEL